jgi:hypothetical protein
MTDEGLINRRPSFKGLGVAALTAVLMLWSPCLWSQCSVEVKSEEGAIPGAVVWSGGQPLGMTDSQGFLRWTPAPQADADAPLLRIRAVGFEEQTVRANCASAEPTRVVLQDLAVALGGATVVGSLTPMSVKASPIRTQVISGNALRAVKAQDVAEALDFTNGVRETVACGVCGTNDLHING